MEKHELKLIILQTPAEPVLFPHVSSSQLLYLYLFNDGDPPSKYGLALSCQNWFMNLNVFNQLSQLCHSNM